MFALARLICNATSWLTRQLIPVLTSFLIGGMALDCVWFRVGPGNKTHPPRPPHEVWCVGSGRCVEGSQFPLPPHLCQAGDVESDDWL